MSLYTLSIIFAILAVHYFRSVQITFKQKLAYRRQISHFSSSSHQYREFRSVTPLKHLSRVIMFRNPEYLYPMLKATGQLHPKHRALGYLFIRLLDSYLEVFAAYLNKCAEEFERMNSCQCHEPDLDNEHKFCAVCHKSMTPRQEIDSLKRNRPQPPEPSKKD